MPKVWPCCARWILKQLFDLLALSAFFALALVRFIKNSNGLKYLTMIVSIAYLGFLKSSLVSIVNIFGLMEWNFPLFRYNLCWYFLMSFTVISTFGQLLSLNVQLETVFRIGFVKRC